jgi:hypothetical protein
LSNIEDIYKECDERADAPDFFYVPSKSTMQAIIIKMLEEEHGPL